MGHIFGVFSWNYFSVNVKCLTLITFQVLLFQKLIKLNGTHIWGFFLEIILGWMWNALHSHSNGIIHQLVAPVLLRYGFWNFTRRFDTRLHPRNSVFFLKDLYTLACTICWFFLISSALVLFYLSSTWSWFKIKKITPSHHEFALFSKIPIHEQVVLAIKMQK